MLARTEEEFKIYEAIDIERHNDDIKRWAESGNTTPYTRLIRVYIDIFLCSVWVIYTKCRTIFGV